MQRLTHPEPLKHRLLRSLAIVVVVVAAAAAAVGFVASILPWLADLLREWTLLFFCTQRRCCPRWRNVDPNCCVQFECFLFSCLQVNIYNLLSCEICNLVASLKLSISQQIVTFTRILLVIFARKKQMKTHCVRVCKCDSYMACECC